MKKVAIYFSIMVASSFVLTSCNNDLILTAEPKDIPVVYGLLSASDTAHFIRIEKAFLDPSTSALELAKITDSVYYRDIDVRINNRLMTRVDGNQVGFQQMEGVFTNDPNVLYMLEADDLDLVPGQQMNLEINRGETLELVTAAATVLGQASIQRPNPQAMLSVYPGNDFDVLWLDNGSAPAAFYDVNVFSHVSERNNGVTTKKVLKWRMARGVEDTRAEADGEQYLSFLKGQLEADGSNRTLDSVDVEVVSGGQELKDFLRIIQANTGVTSSQDIPQFSNISEGLGLFTSVNRQILTGYRPNMRMLDSLRNSPLTKDLNF